MALITGRINALPPTPPSSTNSPTHRGVPRHATSMSVAGFDSHSEEDDVPSRHQRPQSLSAFEDYNENLSGGAEDKRRAAFSSRLKHQAGFRYSHLEHMDFENEKEAGKEDSDPITEPNNQVSDDGAKMQPSPDAKMQSSPDAKMQPTPVPSKPKSPAQNTEVKQQPPRKKATFFSSRELNHCILASESTRALSSLIIAVVVVFYYLISKSVLASRPLYILLLTDVTIVFARLHCGKAIVVEENEGEKGKTPGDGHSWGDAVKLLERGLVAYQALRGAFIDCSIYLVVVVCATSIV
ncbi:hypothetical protein ACSQ67_021739 [Phaseolus vulgaris]